MSLEATEKDQINHQPVGANIPKQIIPQQNLLEQNTTLNQIDQPLPKIKNEDAKNKEEAVNQNKEITNKDSKLLNTINGFNPMNHVPPKYDIYGYLKPIDKRREDMSILSNKDNIKIPWCEKNSNVSGAMTRTELIAKRKKEKIPDISYDLDQDGYVGGRDYVIAKRYDVDNDGKLNEQEKKAAYEGIKNKIEENYVWNIDKLGGVRN